MPTIGGATIKPGRVAVLLENEANVLSFNRINLRVHAVDNDDSSCADSVASTKPDAALKAVARCSSKFRAVGTD